MSKVRTTAITLEYAIDDIPMELDAIERRICFAAAVIDELKHILPEYNCVSIITVIEGFNPYSSLMVSPLTDSGIGFRELRNTLDILETREVLIDFVFLTSQVFIYFNGRLDK